jgi:formate C-acetyltransferase
LEKGIDKTWGGADYILSGMVYIAMPNVANALAAIKEWVFDKKKYSLEEVLTALKKDFKGYEKMRDQLMKSPKFGNNNPQADAIMKWLMDSAFDAVKYAEKLCDEVFVERANSKKERDRIQRLRHMAGYSGGDMKRRFGKDFSITFSAGCGTFAQYAFFGTLSGTSADGRFSGKPVASNFSPVSGTAANGAGAVLSSFKSLGFNRFGLGVMVDMCFNQNEISKDYMEALLRKFRKDKGSILSLTVVDHQEIKKVHKLCKDVRSGKKNIEALFPYNNITVRAGGWNSPFVALTEVQQQDYIDRVVGR